MYLRENLMICKKTIGKITNNYINHQLMMCCELFFSLSYNRKSHWGGHPLLLEIISTHSKIFFKFFQNFCCHFFVATLFFVWSSKKMSNVFLLRIW